MTAGSAIVDEPRLTISRPPRFWGSHFGRVFVASVCVMLVGLAMIGVDKALGSASVVTVRGIMASKEDFFKDDKVKELLRERGFAVEITSRGSREVAHEVIEAETDQYDFAFPSGQPAADLIKEHRRRNGAYQKTTDLFSTPIVLASYREYAEILVAEGVATAPPSRSKESLYYTLDTAKFVGLGESGEVWNGIGSELEDRPIRNGNRVLAHTSGVCRSNSGATYLGLVAFVKNQGRPPQTEAEIDRLAQEIQPLITATGMPESRLFKSYVTPEGKSTGPIVVVYEHQYLEYQIDFEERTGRADTSRVLLYPREEFQTDPEFIALKPGPADRLAELLATDPDLRKRMMELGYRVFDATDEVGSSQLFEFLADRGLQVPHRDEATRALLPQLDLLESLIHKAGRCT